MQFPQSTVAAILDDYVSYVVVLAIPVIILLFVQTIKEKGLLTKKWTSVLRLSKQVQELEKRLEVAERAAAEAPISQPGIGHGTRGAGGRMLPVAPSAAQLKGHRGDSIHCVRAHPTFGIVASAGDDSSVSTNVFLASLLEWHLRGGEI